MKNQFLVPSFILIMIKKKKKRELICISMRTITCIGRRLIKVSTASNFLKKTSSTQAVLPISWPMVPLAAPFQYLCPCPNFPEASQHDWCLRLSHPQSALCFRWESAGPRFLPGRDIQVCLGHNTSLEPATCSYCYVQVRVFSPHTWLSPHTLLQLLGVYSILSSEL